MKKWGDFGMSETTSEVTATAGEHDEQSQAGEEFTAITSQEDFNKAIQARIARERAKIPADYDELKAKAAKLAEIEEANKTEAEKAADRLAAAERRAVELEVQVTRAEVAASKGVPVSLLTGSTREELESAADALIEFKAANTEQSRKVPNTWDRPSKTTTVADQFADWSESAFN